MRLPPPVSDEEIEALLRRERRARLPLRRQVLIYLDPFPLFKDVSRGPVHQRQRALSYNRKLRWVLLPYMRRWATIAAASFAGVAPAEALAGQASFFLLPAAALAVGSCIAVTVTACIAAGYFLLSR